jgi:pimeloyl-ACP methyl ester carboxylesterase
MMDELPRTFVLVHGAWHGGWVWRDVLSGLRALGYRATAPTLTGLGERRHLGNDAVDLETHIKDVVSHIEMEDLRNVTLVGWSYGGMVVTGVLARIPARITSLVYLDAFVPGNGRALVDYIQPETKAGIDIARDKGEPLPPLPMAYFGVTDPAVLSFVEPRLNPHPWRSFYQPVRALKVRPDIPITYVVCTGFARSPFTARLEEMKADPKVRTAVIPSSHLCMLTAPEDTIAVLTEA